MRKPLEQQHGREPARSAFLMRALGRDALPLFLGLMLALLTGWAVFPQVLYSREEQPMAFNHVLHIGQAGLDCGACHYLRSDGSFAGRPSLENCAECHSTPLGKDPAEQRLISEYIEPGREIPWFTYAGQPDHVFFSHAAHSLERCNACHEFTEIRLCARCHADMSAGTELPAYVKDRLTGYSKDAMAMSACERCHALPDHAPTTASNDCAVCHK